MEPHILDCERIGIISDTHGDANAWRKAAELFEGCGALLHAGDVLFRGGKGTDSGQDLADLINIYKGKIFIAMGNCDSFADQQLLLPVLEPVVFADWNGRSIVMAHGNNMALLRSCAAERRASLVISGHTHVARISREGSAIYLNPGSASRPMGNIPASIAVADGAGVSVLDLNGKVLYAEKW